MNTIQTTNAQNTEQVIGCHNPMITGLLTKASSGLSYSCPIYIQDLNNVASLRIILRDSLLGSTVADTAGVTCGSYSMMFRITPIFS